MQGSNTSGILKLIKEDHFACTTKMFEIFSRISSQPHQYTDALGLTSSRLSDYSLAKEQLFGPISRPGEAE
jgi:hypothetical protein